MSDNEEWGFWRRSIMTNSNHWVTAESKLGAEAKQDNCLRNHSWSTTGPVQRKSDPNPFEVKSPAAVDVAVAVDDSVAHPKHYTWLKGVEAIDLCEQMNYNLGAAIKYIVRCDHKGNWKKDLEKALWYLNREIARREKQK